MANGHRVRPRELPLRTKLAVTVAGAGLVLLGAAAYLSFGYARAESLVAAEQQALMAAVSVRASVESALLNGQRAQARAGLQRLTSTAPVTAARIYGPDGTIVLSADEAEEGRREPGVWIPSAREVPGRGLVRGTPDREAVRAFLPLVVPGTAVLEVRFSVAPLKAAMDRGARLGLGLLLGSLLTLAVVFSMVFEREVVGRVRRVSGLLEEGGAGGSPAGSRVGGVDELGRLEASVVELVEKERAAAREAAEQRRRAAERAGFAEVGELAAEMAHEFKRPLASIRTAVELLRQEYAVEAGGGALIGALESQLERLNETMRDVFALARPAMHAPESVELGQVVNGALLQLAGHPAAAGLSTHREYDEATPVIWGDGKRLEQAFANLALNAVEAMAGGGTLTMRVRPAGEGWVEVEVADTGAGIPPGQLEQVMKPFYSTKAAGTGLGLPLVARIVASHGGRVTVESDMGVGTTVRVHLPVGEPVSIGHEEAMWQTRAS
jgi:two-component system, NtrC family, sensor kinase